MVRCAILCQWQSQPISTRGRKPTGCDDDFGGTDEDKAKFAGMWIAAEHPSVKSSKRNTMTLGYDSKTVAWQSAL